MSKEQIKRATLEDIVKAKIQKEQDRLILKDILIPSIGKSLRFRRPTRSEICDFMDKIGESENQTEEMIEVFQDLIYACCDELHSNELFEQLEIENPENIVPAIMDDSDILKVGDEVAALNPLYKQFAEEEKNS